MDIEKERKDGLVREVQQYFRDELELELGDLAAGFTIDFFIELVEPLARNQALVEARRVAMEKADSLQEELMLLEKPVTRR